MPRKGVLHKVTLYLYTYILKLKTQKQETKVSVKMDVSLPIMMIVLQLIINNIILPKPSFLRTAISLVFLILVLYTIFMREVIKVEVEQR